MRHTLIAMAIILNMPLWADTFHFGECSGSGSFKQQIHQFTNYEDAVTVGEIPAGIKGLHVELLSDNDVDIRLYGHKSAGTEDKIVHWPHGLLNRSFLQSKPYEGINITYSGYNGVGEKKGHEYIEVNGTTPVPMTMKAFGYVAGFATVNYSWTGKDGCSSDNNGTGHFVQDIVKEAISVVGTIPNGINNLEIMLTSDKDLDIQLYGADGTAIVSWKPTGLLAGSTEQSIDYHGMHIIWSGYDGFNGQKGHEYIKITNMTTEVLTMKVYGYESGSADVDYTWGKKIIKGIKKAPAGLVLRGKTKYSYCDFARKGVDGGYCQIAWADLEPTEGNFDYHLIEEALEKARVYNEANGENFKVLLRIRTGIYSPSWILDKVGSVDWYFRDDNDKYGLPIFWEKPFQNEYENLMSTLSEKYDNNDNIGLIAASMCMTKHTEIMWNRTGRTEVNSLNMENLLAAKNVQGMAVPYSNEKDFNCLKEQINIHAKVWKRTPTIFGSHLYQIYDEDDGSHTPNYEPTLTLFDYCTDTLDKRCIVGNNSLLHTENNTDYNINRAITRTANKGFNTYFQTHVFKNNSSKSFDFDNLIVAIDHAASWGAMMVELPMGWDCTYGQEKEEDPLTCTQAEYKSSFLKDGRDALKANFKE